MISGPKAARELIAFYLDAGVDALLREEPVNRMADDTAAARPWRDRVRPTRGQTGAAGPK